MLYIRIGLRTIWGALRMPLLAVLSALLVGGGIVAAAGYDPWAALTALIGGAFGDRHGLSETLLKTCPLLWMGLAVALAFRAGVWNIGAEGQFHMGALAVAYLGTAGAQMPGWILLLLCFAAAFAAGGLWGWIAGALKARRGVQEIISTIMLNFIALGLISFAVHGPLMEAGGKFPQTDPIAEGARLLRFLPPTRLHAGVLLSLIAAALVYGLLHRTTLGYRLRAIGLNPRAARYAGIDVERHIVLSMVLSGGLAGVAGMVELSGVTYRLYEKFSPGYGYTAIAVALLGRLDPIGVVLSALLFGALNAGSGAMQRVAGVSSVLVYVLQATVIFFVVGYGGRQKAVSRKQ